MWRSISRSAPSASARHDEVEQQFGVLVGGRHERLALSEHPPAVDPRPVAQ
jgi:hypothetical protein